MDSYFYYIPKELIYIITSKVKDISSLIIFLDVMNELSIDLENTQIIRYKLIDTKFYLDIIKQKTGHDKEQFIKYIISHYKKLIIDAISPNNSASYSNPEDIKEYNDRFYSRNLNGKYIEYYTNLFDYDISTIDEIKYINNILSFDFPDEINPKVDILNLILLRNSKNLNDILEYTIIMDIFKKIYDGTYNYKLKGNTFGENLEDDIKLPRYHRYHTYENIVIKLFLRELLMNGNIGSLITLRSSGLDYLMAPNNKMSEKYPVFVELFDYKLLHMNGFQLTFEYIKEENLFRIKGNVMMWPDIEPYFDTYYITLEELYQVLKLLYNIIDESDNNINREEADRVFNRKRPKYTEVNDDDYYEYDYEYDDYDALYH
jgi:hypothetical protein